MGFPNPDLPDPDAPATPAGPSDSAPRERPDWLVGADEALEHSYCPPEGGAMRPPAPTQRPEPPAPRGNRPQSRSPAAAPLEEPPPVESPTAVRRESEPDWLMQKYEPPPSDESTEPARPGKAAPRAPTAVVSVRCEPAASVDDTSKPGNQPSPSPVRSLLLEALHHLRTERWVQILAAGILLAVVLVPIGLHAAAAVPLSGIRANPEAFDGRSIVIRGRVGEVFQVGSSRVFYLHQGGDSIVVFSRWRGPTPGKRLEVRGLVSTGYLDGVARPAIFEEDRRR